MPWFRPTRPALRHVATGAVCAAAGYLFAVSADVAGGTDLRPERSDLTQLVSGEQSRLATAADRVDSLRRQVQDRADAAAAAADPAALAAEKRAQQALADATGLAPLTGAGLTVVLDDAPQDTGNRDESIDNDELVVHQQDVQAVVNALWAGGAQGVQLMDQRVISTSAVRCVGSTIFLQGRIYPPPYRISAVGPVDRMIGALDAAPGVKLYREYVDLVGLTYDVTRHGSLTLPAYEGSLGLSDGITVATATASSTAAADR